MSNLFNLEFLDNRKVHTVIDLGKNNLKYICSHLNSRCEIFTKEGSREFAEEFNKVEENKTKQIKLINSTMHIKEYPKDFADLIVVKDVDFNSKEIYRVLKKFGLVIIYFPITKNFDDSSYLKRVQDYFNQIGFERQHLFKNQSLDDGLFHVMVAMK